MTQSPDSKLVSSVEHKPCGCTVTVYSDERKDLAPCLPCGLHAAFRHLSNAAGELQNAAMAMAATATTLRRLQNAMTNQEILKDSTLKVVR